MSQDTGQRAAEIVISPEDELSIDDLDRIVGGLNGDQLPVHEGGDGPYVPPVVHAPDHLPTQINNVETNVSQTAVTDSKGFYQATHLNPGNYSVSTALEGFKPMVRRGLQVRIGDDIPIDFKMELGGVSETISVTASTPVLDTTPNTGQVIESKQIDIRSFMDGLPPK